MPDMQLCTASTLPACLQYVKRLSKAAVGVKQWVVQLRSLALPTRMTAMQASAQESLLVSDGGQPASCCCSNPGNPATANCMPSGILTVASPPRPAAGQDCGPHVCGCAGGVPGAGGRGALPWSLPA